MNSKSEGIPFLLQNPLLVRCLLKRHTDDAENCHGDDSSENIHSCYIGDLAAKIDTGRKKKNISCKESRAVNEFLTGLAVTFQRITAYHCMRQNFAEAENDDTDGDHIGHSAKLGGNSVNQRDDCQTLYW